MTNERRKFKFIGCEIVYREACLLAATGPHRVDVEFLLKGLHDLPRQDMLQRIQTAIDGVDANAGYEAILLGYARCNDGLVGIKAGAIPLVIPRAHDCITFFFGSRAEYRRYFDEHPGTYYLTSGWSERNIGEGIDYARPAYDTQGVMGKLGLTETYEEMVEKYGKENADFLAATVGDWRKNYSRFLYLTMGICDESRHIAAARDEAVRLSWTYDERAGDLSLLRRLFEGPWNEDFVVVAPGHQLIARNDALVLDNAPPPRKR
jgi:hypothetical protein